MKRRLLHIWRAFTACLRRRYVLPAVMALALTVVCLLGGRSLGRYIYESTYGKSSTVSTFLVTAGLDDATLTLVADERVALSIDCSDDDPSATIGFRLSSSSSVMVGYTVRVELGAVLPVGVSITLNDGEHVQTLVSDGVSTAYEFPSFGTIAASGDVARHVDFTLTLTVTDTDAITDEVNIPTASLTVIAEQVFS